MVTGGRGAPCAYRERTPEESRNTAASVVTQRLRSTALIQGTRLLITDYPFRGVRSDWVSFVDSAATAMRLRKEHAIRNRAKRAPAILCVSRGRQQSRRHAVTRFLRGE